MRLAATLPLLASLVLVACNSKPGVDAKNVSPEAVQKQVAVAGVFQPKPGRWEGSLKIEKMDFGKMPPEAQARMQRSLGAVQHYTSCLTAEQIAKMDGSAIQKMHSGCTYEHFSMSGGRIEGKMVCEHGAIKQTIATSGHYTAESMDVTTVSTSGSQPGMPMNMTMSMTSHRVGDCNGTEDK